MNKIGSFFNGVKKEIERVKWPTKKDMFKYTITTIIFTAFLALFFFTIDLVFSFIKSLWG